MNSKPQPAPSTTSPPIAQVIGTFGGGGAERLAYNLGLGLRSLGVECMGIAIRRAGKYAAGGELPVMSLEAEEGGAVRTLAAMGRLRRVIREKRIGLIHVHGSRSLPFCALALVGMRRRPRMWFTWHDSGLEVGRGWRWRLMAWALNRCERVFGASRQIAAKLETVPGLGGRVEVFRNGVPEIAERVPHEGREPVILWMARFVGSKDPQILIRAAARLRDEGLKFRVIMAGAPYPGGEAFFEECRQLARDLKLEEILSFPGWVDDTTALIRSADIGVQTSHAEGLSMTLLEMMMAGLAVVATDVGDTREAVRDGETGALVELGDDAGLTDVLRRTLTDGAYRAAMRDAARQTALRESSLGQMAHQILTWYARGSLPIPTEPARRCGHKALPIRTRQAMRMRELPLGHALVNVARSFFGEGGPEDQWQRIVLNREVRRLVDGLGPGNLEALEISGDSWARDGYFGQYRNVHYPNYDVCAGCLDEQFDLIIAEQVFEHLLWPYRAARNIHAMLRPGGHFLITTPFLLKIHECPYDCTRWTETGLKHLLAEAGFPLEKTVTGSWGNKACVRANLVRWQIFQGWRHSLENNSEFPVQVWALATKT